MATLITMEEKLNHLKILDELKLDIIKNGKIRQMEKDFDGFEYPFPCEEDIDRIKSLEHVMDVYCYGWYIATETLEEQLLSLTKFEHHILLQPIYVRN